MPLTHRQIVNDTPEITKLRTRICAIRLVDKGKHINDKKLGKCFSLLYNLRCLDGNRFVTLKYIGPKKPGLDGERDQDYAKPSLDSEIWVSCTCPYHLYNSEYALTQQGSSDIIYSNGEPAFERNPNNEGFVCKHILLALQHALNEYVEAPPTPKPSWKDRLKKFIKTKTPESTKEEAPKEAPEENIEKPDEDQEENQDETKPKTWKDKLNEWLKIK